MGPISNSSITIDGKDLPATNTLAHWDQIEAELSKAFWLTQEYWLHMKTGAVFTTCHTRRN